MKYYLSLYFIIGIYSFSFCQSAEAHFKKGKKIFEEAYITDQYEFARAIAEFTEAIEIDPKYIEAYEYRGNIKDMLQDYRGAIKDYSKVIEIAPSDFYTLARRGSAYTQLKQYTKALQDYNKAIDLAKDNKYALSELYYSRGSVRLFSNQKEKACNDFSKAGELGNSAAFGMIKEYCK